MKRTKLIKRHEEELTFETRKNRKEMKEKENSNELQKHQIIEVIECD